MARYVTMIESRLAPDEAFAYMADFANARDWDPSVSEARRVGDDPIGTGTSFDLLARLAGRDVPLRYEIVEYEPARRVVLEARRPGFVSRDTITVAPAAPGSEIRYDAHLEFEGIRRLLDPLLQRLFDRIGAAARAGMHAVLNP